jgi:hypothetical protein
MKLNPTHIACLRAIALIDPITFTATRQQVLEHELMRNFKDRIITQHNRIQFDLRKAGFLKPVHESGNGVYIMTSLGFRYV